MPKAEARIEPVYYDDKIAAFVVAQHHVEAILGVIGESPLDMEAVVGSRYRERPWYGMPQLDNPSKVNMIEVDTLHRVFKRVYRGIMGNEELFNEALENITQGYLPEETIRLQNGLYLSFGQGRVGSESGLRQWKIGREVGSAMVSLLEEYTSKPKIYG